METYTAYLLLGGNLGDCVQTFKAAREKIALRSGRISRASRLYTSPSWGFEAKELFYNQVLELQTTLDPYALLQQLLQIETELGRVRSQTATAPEKTAAASKQYASRTIDIDILFYEDFVIRSRNLSLPHPLMQQRAFVLVPLAELVPAFLHPVFGVSVAELLAKCSDDSSKIHACPMPEQEIYSDVAEKPFPDGREAGSTLAECVPTGSCGTSAAFWPENMRFLAIEGNIGAGKTSLSRRIATQFGAKWVVESFEENVFLPKFYADKERFAFPLELAFLAERYRQAKEDFVQELFSPFLVSDFSISKSLIFAQNTLQEDEYRLFKRLYDIILTTIPKPDLYVYIHSDVDRLMRNIRQRGRSYEANMDPAYLKTIENGYREYMKTLDPARSLWIDVTDMDFIHNEADYREVLSRIQAAARWLG